MTDSTKMMLRNLIQNAQQDVRTYQQAYREIRELEEENRRLNWLIRNGERCFGSLWKEATIEDIEMVMRLPSECQHQWVYETHIHKKDIWKCLLCGEEQER